MGKEILIHRLKPPGFQPKVEVVGCFLEFAGRLLLLKRAADRPEPGVWGLPGGKVDGAETSKAAILREVFEETGIRISQVDFLGSLYIKKPALDYVYHEFSAALSQKPQVILSDEHTAYCWVSKEEIEEMPLMIGGSEILQARGWKR